MRKSFTSLAMLATAAILLLAMPAIAQTAAPVPDVGKMLWAAVLGAGPLLWPVINGPIVAFLTELAKRAPAVPFQGNTATGLIVVLGALSTLTTLAFQLAIAWLSGNLAAFDMANAVTVLVQVVGSVLAAAGSFGLFKKATA